MISLTNRIVGIRHSYNQRLIHLSQSKGMYTTLHVSVLTDLSVICNEIWLIGILTDELLNN